ncbi:MAG: hypothetical protein EZS28_047012 [Streblomastix strix]|uniref:Uncharacterized protein n=1 Tax=Streblomastix strix TaxID=222440 RepID=A0A5J4TIV2_9EUKA|nr:MAG: hypothetical protein EZS28_047012 [Streblomastix strix]
MIGLTRNVIGLIGIGPDILLKILSELILLSNAFQFIGINKKTFQLKNHSRFYKIIETLNCQKAILNPDPTDIEFSDVDGGNKQHIAIFVGQNLGVNVFYKGKSTSGITEFRNNQIARLKFDSEKDIVTHFIDNVQQPTFISGIKEKVRFVVCF